MPGEYYINEVIPVTPIDEPAWFQSYPGIAGPFDEPVGHEVSLPEGVEGSPYNFGNWIEPFDTFEFDIGIVKSVDKPVAQPGDILNYTLVYTNNGSALIDEPVTITDVFDDTYLSVVDPSGGTVSGNTITWNLDRDHGSR